MGKTLVTAKIENLFDLEKKELGELDPDKMRTVEVTDALVDTGATGLLLPKRLIDQLGLRAYRTRQGRTIAGIHALTMYTAVRLTVQGRDCIVPVAELPEECPVLIGQIPLESLDFVVDPNKQQLIGNPAHGGEQMIEMY